MAPPPIPVDHTRDTDSTSWYRNAYPHSLENLLSPVGPVGGRFPQLLERPPCIYQIGKNSEISPQDLQQPGTRQTDVNTTPLDRFYDEIGPWTPQKVVGDVGPPSSTLDFPGLYPQLNQLPISSQIQHRSRDRSEVGSSTTGRNPQDSGYESKSYTTKSVRSSEYIDPSQDCQSLVSDVGDFQIPSYGMNDGPSSQGQLVCRHPGCENTTFKNQSDQK